MKPVSPRGRHLHATLIIPELSPQCLCFRSTRSLSLLEKWMYSPDKWIDKTVWGGSTGAIFIIFALFGNALALYDCCHVRLFYICHSVSVFVVSKLSLLVSELTALRIYFEKGFSVRKPYYPFPGSSANQMTSTLVVFRRLSLLVPVTMCLQTDLPCNGTSILDVVS